jgi:hypothetical protein
MRHGGSGMGWGCWWVGVNRGSRAQAPLVSKYGVWLCSPAGIDVDLEMWEGEFPVIFPDLQHADAVLPASESHLPGLGLQPQAAVGAAGGPTPPATTACWSPPGFGSQAAASSGNHAAFPAGPCAWGAAQRVVLDGLEFGGLDGRPPGVAGVLAAPAPGAAPAFGGPAVAVRLVVCVPGWRGRIGAAATVSEKGSCWWLPNRDRMSYSACQIGPRVSCWFRWWSRNRFPAP